MSEEPWQNYGRGLVDRKLVEAPPPPPPQQFIAGRPKAALPFGSLVIVDVVCPYLSLFVLYINIGNIETGKKIDVKC